MTLLEVRNARLKGLSPAMKDLFDLLQLRYATMSSDFPAQYAGHLERHDVAPEAVNAFSRLIGSKAVRRLYDKLQKKKKEGANMSLSVAEWEREWVEEIHPEWIEVHDADQKKIKDLESENGNLVSKNKQLESDFEQLARFIVPGFMEEGRAAHATEDAIIETIVSKTGVSQETARRLVSEYCDHKG